MRNKYIQSPEKIIDRILNYPHKEKGCSYICGPHLEPCVMVRAHDGDCECRECNANSPFRIAAQKWREKQGMSKPTQQGQNVSHLDCEMSHQDANHKGSCGYSFHLAANYKFCPNCGGKIVPPDSGEEKNDDE